MDYKKKYEQALERAKVINPGTADYEVAVKIFPELKENEDERIREALMLHIKYKVSVISGWRKEELIAWLKKQGEQKPEIKYIYPKFRVGDVIEPAKPNGSYVPVRVNYIGEGAYSCESDDRTAFLSLPICYENDYVLTKQKPTQWTDKDLYYYNKLEYFLQIQDHYSPTEKSSSYQKDVHETLLWLKSLHPNKHVAWSEEDENLLKLSIDNLIELKKRFGDGYGKAGDCIFWLKSLKQRMKGE